MQKNKFCNPMELVSFGDDPYLKPYIPIIQRRYGKYLAARTRLTGSPRRTSLKAAAAEHKFFGLHRQKDGSWVFREWAPAAARIILAGDFSNFAEQKRFELHRIPDRPGCWEITLPGSILRHGMHYEEKLYFADGTVHRRLPAYADYVVQDSQTQIFTAQVYDPACPYRFRHPSPPRPETSTDVRSCRAGAIWLATKRRQMMEYSLNCCGSRGGAGSNPAFTASPRRISRLWIS